MCLLTDGTFYDQFQANMHAAFGYDRRDPYSRLPIDTPPHQSSNGGVDPIVDHTVEHNVSTLVIGLFHP